MYMYMYVHVFIEKNNMPICYPLGSMILESCSNYRFGYVAHPQKFTNKLGQKGQCMNMELHGMKYMHARHVYCSALINATCG